MPSQSLSVTKGLRVFGEANLPDGGVLLLPNRLGHLGLQAMSECFSGRQLTYLVESSGDYDPQTKAFLDAAGIDAFSFDPASTDLEEVRKVVHSAVSKGRVVVCVPAPTLSRVGSVSDVAAEVYEFLLDCQAPTIALSVDRPSGSSLQIDKTGSDLVFSFGKLLDADALSYAAFQESLLAAIEEAFSKREFLNQHLAFALLQGLKRYGSTQKVVDGLDESEMGFDKLLAAAIVLSKLIRKETSKKRVAIVLPPGKGGILANVAVLFAGKVPVNLNFTASHEAIESSVKQAGIDRMITADPFVRKMPKFPWPANREMILARSGDAGSEEEDCRYGWSSARSCRSGCWRSLSASRRRGAMRRRCSSSPAEAREIRKG